MPPTTQHPELPRLTVNEAEAAAAIGMSVAWLRKDRRTHRLIPYYRLGGRILYNLDRVRDAMARLEEGGHTVHHASTAASA